MVSLQWQFQDKWAISCHRSLNQYTSGHRIDTMNYNINSKCNTVINVTFVEIFSQTCYKFHHSGLLTNHLASTDNNNNNNNNNTRYKIDDLSRAIERLTLLQAHDALVILKNSLAIPKLLYLLRTSDCGVNPLLSEFDNTLRLGLTTECRPQ